MYEKYKHLRGNIIILEGNIGTGKSSLGRRLTQYLNSIGLKTRFHEEYYNEELLELYVNNMKKYAFSFQVIIARERIRANEEAIRAAQKGEIVILDRSLIGDQVFANIQKKKGFFTEKEWRVYKSLTKHDIRLGSIVIYLRIDPKTALKRIKGRDIYSENNKYDMEYISSLHDEYENVMESTSKNDAYRTKYIDWSEDREITDKVCQSVLNKI